MTNVNNFNIIHLNVKLQYISITGVKVQRINRKRSVEIRNVVTPWCKNVVMVTKTNITVKDYVQRQLLYKTSFMMQLITE